MKINNARLRKNITILYKSSKTISLLVRLSEKHFQLAIIVGI